MGREDILNLNLKQKCGSIPNHRISTTAVPDNPFGTSGKLTKSYSAWITWYKTNINVDDYKKFISRKVTLTSSLIVVFFHYYFSRMYVCILSSSK